MTCVMRQLRLNLLMVPGEVNVRLFATAEAGDPAAQKVHHRVADGCTLLRLRFYNDHLIQS